MRAETPPSQEKESLHELLVTGYFWMGAWVFCLGQIASVGILSLGLPVTVGWLFFFGVELLTMWATFTQLFPRHRLFFNDHRLLICDLQGHVQWVLDQPRAFCAPFFIGVQLSALQSIGVFKAQMNPADFSRLVRWAKGLDS